MSRPTESTCLRALSMSFAPAVLSRRQAHILRELVWSKAERLKAHGIRVGSSGIGAGEPYLIGYSSNELSAQTIEPFLIFGPGTVRFVQEPPPVPLSREADTYPFGRAHVTGPKFPDEDYGSMCSFRFRVISRYTGGAYLITALRQNLRMGALGPAQA